MLSMHYITIIFSTHLVKLSQQTIYTLETKVKSNKKKETKKPPLRTCLVFNPATKI